MFKKLFSRESILGSIGIRVVGIFMAFFLTGAGVGGASPVGWLWGGLLAVGTVLGTVVTVLGVILIWKAHWTLADIEKVFRAVVAEQAEDNEEIKKALEVTEMEDFSWDDFGDLDEEE